MPHSPLIVVHTSCCEQAALVLKPLASLASGVRDDAFWWLAHNQTSIPCRPSVHASAEASHRHNLGARAGTLQRSSGTRNFVPSESPLRLGHQNDGSPAPQLSAEMQRARKSRAVCSSVPAVAMVLTQDADQDKSLDRVDPDLRLQSQAPARGLPSRFHRELVSSALAARAAR